ncbi:hypothetical protein RHSIM_Rhsim06G0190300 [Rhododendron simsii]|uniref:Terpene synthase metal-binding domain-containing protein n=1 Tax=Rhododendron simsii TaxID=118357 RepID=A0A834GWY3_RHOSS|nr:hypothetical protein RHSIM_Rhsim06G0190300 [Rhododendron simsii]
MARGRKLEVITWWKDLDFARKLPFARDRVVECYFWILGVYFEPQYFLARRILTKVIAMTSIIDDIYDVYGTLEELVLFTDAIERWENSALDQLPEYMKLCYQALLDVYNMIDEEMVKEGRSYRVNYAKSAMNKLVRAYFEEAKWCHEGYVPSIEEYMRVALVTGAYKMLATTSLVGMGDLVTEEGFKWVSSDPLILEAASVICRLMDDMVGHKVKRGMEEDDEFPLRSEDDSVAIVEMIGQVAFNEEGLRASQAKGIDLIVDLSPKEGSWRTLSLGVISTNYQEGTNLRRLASQIQSLKGGPI